MQLDQLQKIEPPPVGKDWQSWVRWAALVILIFLDMFAVKPAAVPAPPPVPATAPPTATAK
jgi:hypothetical protein